MATGETLYFEGLRFPAAKVIATASVPISVSPPIPPQATGGIPWPRLPGPKGSAARNVFTLATSGRGRKWSTTEPMAFWMNFGELDLENSNEVVGFVRSRGDPDGRLDEKTQISTVGWWDHAALLGVAASLWEETDAEGVKRVTSNKERYQLAMDYCFGPDSLSQNLRNEFYVVWDRKPPYGLVPATRSLFAFMVASASSALGRRVPLRRCDFCGTWTEWTRKDIRFCSSSCRSLYSQRKDK